MDDSWVPIGAERVVKPPPLVPGVPEWLRPEVGQFLARSAQRRPHWLVEYRLTRRNTVDYDELFEHVDMVDLVKAVGSLTSTPGPSSTCTQAPRSGRSSGRFA